MRALAAAAAVVSLLAGHPAHPTGPVARAERGLERADLTAAEVARYRAVLRRAARAAGKLHGERHDALAGALRDVALLARAYTRPRALTLFAMLDENVRYFARHG